MRTVERDVVGGFIFSSDNKVLLGKNRKGGVYENHFSVPGGGIEPDETQRAALRREMLEETGLDVDTADVTPINISNGEHEKTLRTTGERVYMVMTFYDFKVQLHEPAEQVEVTAEDDWGSPEWFTADQLENVSVSGPTKNTLQKIGFIPMSNENS